mmetsp:Transcript_109210/g.308000  ORF Transcript_109210/g.308000 Transcript_109210/m.308000 type:complete len:205 (-) Transcript_109210:346-960(-)
MTARAWVLRRSRRCPSTCACHHSAPTRFAPLRRRRLPARGAHRRSDCALGSRPMTVPFGWCVLGAWRTLPGAVAAIALPRWMYSCALQGSHNGIVRKAGSQATPMSPPGRGPRLQRRLRRHAVPDALGSCGVAVSSWWTAQRKNGTRRIPPGVCRTCPLDNGRRADTSGLPGNNGRIERHRRHIQAFDPWRDAPQVLHRIYTSC